LENNKTQTKISGRPSGATASGFLKIGCTQRTADFRPKTRGAISQQSLLRRDLFEKAFNLSDRLRASPKRQNFRSALMDKLLYIYDENAFFARAFCPRLKKMCTLRFASVCV
jgi:hypothetical protein